VRTVGPELGFDGYPGNPVDDAADNGHHHSGNKNKMTGSDCARLKNFRNRPEPESIKGNSENSQKITEREQYGCMGRQGLGCIGIDDVKHQKITKGGCYG